MSISILNLLVQLLMLYFVPSPVSLASSYRYNVIELSTNEKRSNLCPVNERQLRQLLYMVKTVFCQFVQRLGIRLVDLVDAMKKEEAAN